MKKTIFSKKNLGFLVNLSQKCPFLIREKAYGTWIKINSIFLKRGSLLFTECFKGKIEFILIHAREIYS